MKIYSRRVQLGQWIEITKGKHERQVGNLLKQTQKDSCPWKARETDIIQRIMLDEDFDQISRMIDIKLEGFDLAGFLQELNPTKTDTGVQSGIQSKGELQRTGGEIIGQHILPMEEETSPLRQVPHPVSGPSQFTRPFIYFGRKPLQLDFSPLKMVSLRT